MPTISGHHKKPIVIYGDHQSYTFDKSFHGETEYEAIDVIGKHDKVVFHGRTESGAGYPGIHVNGSHAQLFIAADAVLSGDGYAIRMFGTFGDAVNEGRIHGQVRLDRHSNTFTNDGLIKGDNASVEVGAADVHAINTKNGVISNLTSAAVWAQDVPGAALDFRNAGTVVSGGDFVISGAMNDDRVRNTGRIDGDVWLSGGHDVFDNRGGRITGTIAGGSGNDTLITDRSTDQLIEFDDAGVDTVKSTASYTLNDFVEKLTLIGTRNVNATGNSLDNVIKGNGGDNVLTGGGGPGAHDTLTGGKGDDEFVFTATDGGYVITDFENGHDKIGIIGYGNIHHFSDLDGRMTQAGDAVRIVVSGVVGRTILLEHTQLSEMDKHDFFFG